VGKDKDWEEVTGKGKKLLEKYELEIDDCVSFLGARAPVAQRSYAVSAGTGKICTCTFIHGIYSSRHSSHHDYVRIVGTDNFYICIIRISANRKFIFLCFHEGTGYVGICIVHSLSKQIFQFCANRYCTMHHVQYVHAVNGKTPFSW
jgi:hypothetical protein